jgi:hypothetical protein
MDAHHFSLSSSSLKYAAGTVPPSLNLTIPSRGMIAIVFMEPNSSRELVRWESGMLTAPRSPWQNAYAERFIGSLRRECLDHIIIFNEASLKRILKTYFDYYEYSSTHLSLEKDASVLRAVQLPEMGRVIEVPQVGGLHNRYE